jgi:riboflavin synthase
VIVKQPTVFRKSFELSFSFYRCFSLVADDIFSVQDHVIDVFVRESVRESAKILHKIFGERASV